MRTIFRAVTAATLVVGMLGSFAASANAGYAVKALCAAPAPGYASCLGLRLVPSGPSPAVTPSATPAKAMTPANLLTAYGLSPLGAEPQTIALVDAYDDPHAEEDLSVYDQKYELPACTQANGCFAKINQLGQGAPLPSGNGEWSEEIATDIEVAHSLCQNCHIVLVEAASAEFSDLDAAEEAAAARIAADSKPGALEGEISNSWGGSEPPSGVDSPAFEHPGIPITASAGDAGYLNWNEYEEREKEGSGWFEGPDYPASSPHVIAVGGTSLTLNASGEWGGEEVWNDSSGAGGGGCSAAFPAPSWQKAAAGWASVGCAKRAVADVSADADPLTGVKVYDSVPEALGTPEELTNPKVPGWMQIGGTSVASPIIASVFALAGGAHGVPYPAATLYANAGSAGLHDIVAGGNGECNGVYSRGCSGSLASPLDCGSLATICNAAAGYDGPTGVGTPHGLSAFLPVPGEPGGPGSGSGGSPGGGSGAGGPEGTANPGGGSGSGAGSGSGSSGGAAPSPPSTAKPGVASGTVRLTRLSLTLSAVVALNRGRAPLSRIAFTFTLSRAATVRVTLARRVRVHGHWRWSALRGADTIGGRAGANRARLSGRGVLPAGFYRLTLTPAGGGARSLAISIG
ncbi:MAG: hypothetical protein ACHQDY_03710 [Solirubrobacterales bacterium]